MWHNALLGEAFWPKCNGGVKRHKVYTPEEDKRKTDKRKCFIFLRFIGFSVPLVCTQSARNGHFCQKQKESKRKQEPTK